MKKRRQPPTTLDIVLEISGFDRIEAKVICFEDAAGQTHRLWIIRPDSA